ncbi:MAG: ATP-binding protein [Rhodospirillales bacterium]|jgi:PAS domain S-box-containing protein
MNIKTGFRAVLTVGAVLIGTTILSVGISQYAFFADTSRSERLDRIANEGMQLVQLTHEVLMYGEPRAVAQWQGQYADFGQLISDPEFALDPGLTFINGIMVNHYADLMILQNKLIQARQSKSGDGVAGILASQMFQDTTQLLASLKNLKQISDEALKAAYKGSKQRQIVIFAVFAGLFSFYAIAVLLLFHSVILKPLGNLERTIHATREGIRARARIRADDEIGAICQTFNNLLEEHEQNRRDVQAMAERFRSVFEQAAVGMSLISPNGGWLEVNDCLCRILGFPREEFLGSGYDRFAHPDFLKIDRAHVKKILAGEAPYDSWETRYVRKDGKEIWARVTSALARDENEMPLYFVTVTEDITERKAADARIRDINRRLEEQTRDLKRTNADLESFAWVTSHDLREPLRMVSSYIGLIQKRLGDGIDDDMKTYISYAVDGARRMDALILGLLDYARIGQRGGNFDAVSLGDVIKESLLNLKIAVEEAKATVNLPQDLPMVMGLRGDLVRLFQNLIGNAIKFRHPERLPQIAISAEEGDGEWIIHVADNGIGIDPQYHEKIFRIFQRLVSRDEYEGTGIGLAICKKIVEHMGGRIWIESRPGEGSTFSIALAKSV